MATRLVDKYVPARLLKGADLLALFLVGLTAAIPQFGRDGLGAIYLILVAMLATVLMMRTLGCYEAYRWTHVLKMILLAVGASWLTGSGILGLSQLLSLELPFRWLMLWGSGAAIYFVISRMLAFLWAREREKQGGFVQRIAIVGGGEAAEDALEYLKRSKDQQIEIVGLFDDRQDTRSPAAIQEHRKIGRISELADYARSNRVDLIIVAIPMSAEQRLLKILKSIWELPVDIRISAVSSELKLSPSAYSYLGELPLLNVFERPLRGWHGFLKDIMDRVIALAAIMILSPVMLLVALAVKFESKGPMIFKQKRFGFNNEMIEVFKFRSMYTELSDANAAKLVTKGDPRVTRVGRIIRKTSLDELPQLFNVLRGELSLVGPRPHATQAKAAGTLYDQVVEGYFRRHRVKPGITGWAQVNGWRGETDTREKLEQRVKHDLEYIDQWSLGFDLYILAKTPFSLLKTESAF
jgi:Undecaprenyl-phosphate glucose phosphotransferase